jgi:hypothetical protein
MKFLLNRYTKTFGPFKGWHCYQRYRGRCLHYVNNGGSFARDERLNGHRIFQELKIERLFGDRWVLSVTDGYRDKILKCSKDLNRILYAAIEHQENDNTWNDIVTRKKIIRL